MTVKEMASLGGKARAKKLSKKRRMEISLKANAVKQANIDKKKQLLSLE